MAWEEHLWHFCFKSVVLDSLVALWTGHRESKSLRSYQSLQGKEGLRQQRDLFGTDGSDTKRLKVVKYMESYVDCGKENVSPVQRNSPSPNLTECYYNVGRGGVLCVDWVNVGRSRPFKFLNNAQNNIHLTVENQKNQRNSFQARVIRTKRFNRIFMKLHLISQHCDYIWPTIFYCITKDDLAKICFCRCP